MKAKLSAFATRARGAVPMLDDISRRQFLRGSGASLAGSTIAAFGFGDIEAAHAAAISPTL